MFYSFTLYSELEFLQARPLIFAFLRLVTHTPFPLRQKARTAFPRQVRHTHAAIHALLAMTLASIKVDTRLTFWPEFAHLLSFLNSQPSPNLRKSRAMPTDPLTATVSPKATKRIKAIVSIFVNFKNLCGASGIEPVKDPSVTLLVHRCPHGLGGNRTRLTT